MNDVIISVHHSFTSIEVMNMTWTFPVSKPAKIENNPLQLFSLYQKIGKGQYTRIASTSFTHELAMRVFGHRVLTDMTLSIRPIKITCDKVEGITRFARPMYRRPRARQFGESRI